MNWKSLTVYIISLTLSILVIGGCVSKKEYLLKVNEGKKLSGEMDVLKSDYDRLIEAKNALKKQVNDLEKERSWLQQNKLSLEKEIAKLKDDNVELEEILEAKQTP